MFTSASLVDSASKQATASLENQWSSFWPRLHDPHWFVRQAQALMGVDESKMFTSEARHAVYSGAYNLARDMFVLLAPRIPPVDLPSFQKARNSVLLVLSGGCHSPAPASLTLGRRRQQ